MNPDIYLIRAEKYLTSSGFEQFSIDRLCSAIGTTKRTIYNNFESKDDFFDCITDMQRERIRTDTLPLFSKYGLDAAGILREWFTYNNRFLSSLQPVYLPTLKEYSHTWYNRFSEMMRHSCREFTALLVPRGRHEGLFIRNFDTDSYASYLYRILMTSDPSSADHDLLFLTRSICTDSRSILI